MLLKLRILAIGLLFPLEFFAQTSTDSAERITMIRNTIDVFRQAVAENSSLFNGTEYVGYVARPAGHPFFETQNMVPANVYYDGVLFHDIPILYDLVNDQLIIDNHSKTRRIILNSEKVTYFEIGDHFFIRPQTDSAGGNAPGGFYERLYNGRTKVLVKRKKQVNTITSSEGIRESYDQYNYYDMTLPGVTSVEEASTRFNVRGGSADHNLVLCNNATVFNPSHFFGFFSAFNPDVAATGKQVAGFQNRIVLGSFDSGG